MRRRDIWRVLVLPLVIVGLSVSLISFLLDGGLAAKSAAVGSAIVIFATFASGFIALGPNFNIAGVALARIMLGEVLKILVVMFLFALMLLATSLIPVYLFAGMAVNLLGSFLSFKMLD